MNTESLNICLDFPGTIIFNPIQAVMPKCGLNEHKEESFNFAFADNYINFCENNYERIIPVGHMLSEDEFFYQKPNSKDCISVPGIQYARRKKIIRILKRNFKNTRNKTMLQWICNDPAESARLTRLS